MFQKKNRDINIFNMSAIDLFASSFGAFLLITLMLMPYYLRVPRTVLEELQQCRRELATESAARQQCETRLAQSQQQLRECRDSLQVCQSKLAATFLLVWIDWDKKGTDVDMHVFDPSGAHFYFDKVDNAGRPGRMTMDDTGDGSLQEIWSIFQAAPPGEYVIAYDWFNRKGAPARVTGAIYSKDGNFSLPSVQLTERCKQIGTIRVSASGEVGFRAGGNRVGLGGAEVCRLM